MLFQPRKFLLKVFLILSKIHWVCCGTARNFYNHYYNIAVAVIFSAKSIDVKLAKHPVRQIWIDVFSKLLMILNQDTPN